MQTNKVKNNQHGVRRFLALICFLAVLATGYYYANGLLKNVNSRTAFNPALANLPAHEEENQAEPFERKIYPYSIVRGGLLSREEVYANIRNDKVVAKHYSDFNAEKARVVQAAENRLMYVSYRRGNNVYWTANAVQIPQGETLITDGTNEARTRCGNRLSATPMTPTSDDEPDVAFFDIPENEIPGYFEPDQTVGMEPMPLTQLDDPVTPLSGFNAPPGGISGGNPYDTAGLYNPGIPSIWGGPGANTDPLQPYTPDPSGRQPDPSGPTDVPGKSVVPPGFPGIPDDYDSITPVPEPGAMVLLSSGLAALVFMRIRLRKRIRK